MESIGGEIEDIFTNKMECKGKKKDGTQCNRVIFSEDRNYCYQHTEGIWNKITLFLANLLGVRRRFLLWFLIFSLIFSLIIFILQGYANYRYNQMLDNLYFKPDMEVDISPYIYTATFGEYLPLIVSNTGDLTLKNISIFINSCKMGKRWEHYELPLIPSHSERIIPFGNKEVITVFKNLSCYPFSRENRPFLSFGFNPFLIEQGQNYTTFGYVCGKCYFDAKISANYERDGNTVNFIKNISSSFDSPVGLQITLLDN